MKRQKIFSGALPSRREREKFEKDLKKCFESVKTLFKKKKLDSRCSIDRKTGSINRTRQRLTESFKRNFDLIEKQPQSIEIVKKMNF